MDVEDTFRIMEHEVIMIDEKIGLPSNHEENH